MALPRGLAPLGFGHYATYWIGFVATRTGRSIEEMGAVWLMFVLTESPALVGVLGIARAVPSLVIGPIGGVLADRFDQRRVLFATQAAGLVASLAVAILVAAGLIEFWHLYIQVAVHGAIEAIDLAARQSLFPRLVPRAALPEAITLTTIGGRTSKLVGPLIGGLAIAHVGESLPFFLSAASRLPLMAAVLAMSRLPRTTPIPSSFRQDLLQGLRHITGAPVLSGMLKLELVIALFQINPVIVTVFARQVLGAGPEAVGVLLAAPALGSLVGLAGLVTMGHATRQGRFAIVCTLLYALGLALLGSTSVYLASFGILVAIGVVDSLVTVTRMSMLQLATPPEMRGRVMGYVGTVTHGVTPVGEAQSGILASLIGPTAAILVAGAALAGGAILTARGNPQFWRFTRADGSTTAGTLFQENSPLPDIATDRVSAGAGGEK